MRRHANMYKQPCARAERAANGRRASLAQSALSPCIKMHGCAPSALASSRRQPRPRLASGQAEGAGEAVRQTAPLPSPACGVAVHNLDGLEVRLGHGGRDAL